MRWRFRERLERRVAPCCCVCDCSLARDRLNRLDIVSWFPFMINFLLRQFSGWEGAPVPAWLMIHGGSLIFQVRVVINHLFRDQAGRGSPSQPENLFMLNIYCTVEFQSFCNASNRSPRTS